MAQGSDGSPPEWPADRCCSPTMSSSVPGTYGGSYSTQHPLHAAWISITLYMAAPILPSMTDGEGIVTPSVVLPTHLRLHLF